MRYCPDKSIAVPPLGYADLSGYLPLINSARFQRTKERTQLGLVKEMFPGATHTRMLHHFGVYKIADSYCNELIRRGFLKEDDAMIKNIKIAALLHDIGHPPYSHAMEYVLGAMDSSRKIKNHEEHNLIIVQELSNIIEQIGGDTNIIKSMLSKDKKYAEQSFIFDKSLGADKVAYLIQDHHYTGYVDISPPDLDRIIMHLIFKENIFGVEEKVDKSVKQFQDFYFSMWTQVYLRKQGLGMERLLQKAIEFEIRENEIDPLTIWDQSEAWVNITLENSKNQDVRKIYERIAKRNTLNAAIVFKLPNYMKAERIAAKKISVMPIEYEDVKKFLGIAENPLLLSELESQISKPFGLNASDLVIAVVPEPIKLVPNDVTLFSKKGEKIDTLFTRYPDHHKSLIESADSFFAIRVMVPLTERERISKNAEGIKEIVLDYLKQKGE